MSTKITLKSLTCRGIWKYNFPQNTEDQCQICRRNIMAPSHEDIKNNKLTSRITLGKCGHAFHSDCIATYAKKNVSCPIDFTHWTILKNIDGPIIRK